MPEPLDAELNLSFDEALSGAANLGREIDSALTSAVSSFETELERAVSNTPTAEVTVEAVGVEDITTGIDAAVSAADTSVAVEADTDPAQSEVGALVREVDATTGTIQVEADVGDAEAAVGDLADAADTATSSLSGTGQAAQHTGTDLGLLTGATALARGEMHGLSDAAHVLPTAAVPAVAAVTAVALSAHHLFETGVEATSMLQRFHTIVGENASQIEKFRVGNLDVDLEKLAVTLGTDNEALLNASATLFQFARNSNASREEATLFTQRVDALAARAVALNPALGSVDRVAESLSVRLARGGRFAASFGLSLTAAEINARALADTGKQTAADLTIYEKSAAAAAIATERYGSSLNETITKGAKNAALEQRHLHEELRNVLEEAGKKIVVPAFDLFRAGLPIVKDAADSIGFLADNVLPALTGALTLIGPVLGPVVQGVIAFELASRLAVPSIGALSRGIDTFFTRLPAGVGERVAGSLYAVQTGMEGVARAAPGLAVGGTLIATSIGGLGETVQDTATGIVGFTIAGAALGSAIPGVGTAVGAGVGAITGSVIALGKAVFDGTDDLAKYRAQLDGLAKELEVADQRGAARKFIDSLGETTKAQLGIESLDGSVVHAAKSFQLSADGTVDYGKQMVDVRPKVGAVTKEIESLALRSPAAARRVVDAFGALRTETGKPFFDEAQLQRFSTIIDQQVDKLARRTERQRESDRINQAVTGTTYAAGTAVETETQKLVDNTQATIDATDAKKKQLATLTAYLDTLLASQDATFAATKAQRDAEKADKDLIETNKDETKTELDKKVALDDSITAHEKAAIAAGDAAVANLSGADANVIAKQKVDATVASLEYQKSQVQQGGPVWTALNDYQQKILNTPEYKATVLAITVQADLQATEAFARGIGALESVFGILGAQEGAIIQPKPGGTLVRVAESGSPEVIVPTDDRARAADLLTEAGLADLLTPAASPVTMTTLMTSQPAPNVTTTTNIDRSIHAPIAVYEATEPRATAAALVRRFKDYQHLQGV